MKNPSLVETQATSLSSSRRSWWALGAALLLSALAACEDRKPAPANASPMAAASGAVKPAKLMQVKLDPEALRAYPALPVRFASEKNPSTDPKLKLGRMLYFEPRLSKNHDLSCNSCHDLANYGVDGKPVSNGHKGQSGTRNSPTVYNAAGHFVQFWDGRASTVEEQAKGPILNPVEMAMPDQKAVLEVINSIPQYVALFKEAFPADKEPVSFDNLAKAIGAFERQLVTPSRFDSFRNGDDTALTDKEKAGLAKFIEVGCPTCHEGATVGGKTFQKLGLVKPYPDEADLGRYQETKKDQDKMFFKVPSLRNIAKTGPYFHDGKVATLPDAVKKMAYHQLGLTLKDEDVASIVAFLESLTGTIPAEYVRKPELPPDGPKTPKPDPK